VDSLASFSSISNNCILFVDDIVMMVEASSSQIDWIAFVWTKGRRSTFKSRVFLSNNVFTTNASFFSNYIGIESTNDLGINLVTPMIHHKESPNTLFI